MTHPWPFLCSDRVMHTAGDFNQGTQQYESEIMDFCGFLFSKSALNSAIELIKREDSTTEAVEGMGATIAQNQNEDFSLQFSKAVCDWGRGQRVWANLNRRNDREKLGHALNELFRIAVNTDDAEEAISYGTEISGLGVSFASKHLRMIAPQKYAVLDEVLSDGLGFALNTKGYGLFLHSLRAFKEKYKLDPNLATIESGIFSLIRQLVRAK